MQSDKWTTCKLLSTWKPRNPSKLQVNVNAITMIDANLVCWLKAWTPLMNRTTIRAFDNFNLSLNRVIKLQFLLLGRYFLAISRILYHSNIIYETVQYFVCLEPSLYIRQQVYWNLSKPFFTRLVGKTTKTTDAKRHRRRDTDDRTANKWQINFGWQFNWAGSD